MKLGKYTQADGEKKRYNVDYSQWLDSGEQVASMAYAITPVTTPALQVTNSAVDPSGLSVTFYVSGGVNQNTYKLITTMTTQGGQIKEDAITFNIADP